MAKTTFDKCASLICGTEAINSLFGSVQCMVRPGDISLKIFKELIEFCAKFDEIVRVKNMF